MDDRSQEETNQKKTGLNSFLQKLYRPGPLVLIFITLFVGLVSLGYFILHKETPPPVTINISPEPQAINKVYEEETFSNMEDMVKQGDLAIIEAIRSTNLPMSELDLLDVEMRMLNGRGYHYQVLQIPKLPDRALFLDNLRNYLQKRVPEAALADNGTEEATIVINSLPTHRLMLEAIPMTLPRPQSHGPKLAIVIDDIGEDMKLLKELVHLDFPVTFAVWPHASFTRESVELIVGNRRDLLIHFPMEPRGYPVNNPGDDSLFVSMTKEEIQHRTQENVSRIPEAIGVNNHMGSEFTSNVAGMQIALAEFKKHGLFFLDSLTTTQSICRSAAKVAGVPFYERDIFIDNVKDVAAIILQLKKAESVARKQGHAIAIGHPHPETLAALKQWYLGRDVSLQILPISHLQAE